MTKKLSKYDVIVLSIDNYSVHIYFEKKDLNNSVLLEAKHRGFKQLGSRYSADVHTSRIPQVQKHLHVYAGNNQLFALNRDGTGHDGHHGMRIPNRVQKAISKEFPDFNIPDDGIIESASRAVDLLILMEGI